MKKFLKVMAVSACILALSACGSKGENVETEAPTAASSESAPATVETDAQGQIVALPEDYEPEIIEGIVTELKDNQVTVESEDGTRLAFDITSAERYDDEYLMTGCLVEVSYAIVDADTYPAESISVLMDIEEQADTEGVDPVIYGTVQLMDINDIIIIDETGTERELNNQMSRTVSFSDIKAGDNVAITYSGNLLEDDDERSSGLFNVVAIKIVAEEALGSDEAEANYLTGLVDSLYTNRIMLMTEPVTFDVEITEDMIGDIEENDTIKVYYEGCISGMTVNATSLEKIEDGD